MQLAIPLMQALRIDTTGLARSGDDEAEPQPLNMSPDTIKVLVRAVAAALSVGTLTRVSTAVHAADGVPSDARSLRMVTAAQLVHLAECSVRLAAPLPGSRSTSCAITATLEPRELGK